MNRGLCYLIVFVAFACQTISGEQTACPSSDVAARTLTAKQLSKRVVRRVEPVLPAGFGRIDSRVVITVLVDERGGVTCARGSSDAHPILRRYCEEAARQWRFKPLLAEGKPVAMTGPIVFRLKR